MENQYKCLITGGAGFIGSNLSNFLFSIGWDLDIVDDLSSGNKEFLDVNLRSEKLWVEDFASPEVLDKIKSKHYDYIFHLAANPRVGYSVLNPVESNDINVSKSLLLINACRDSVKKVIFASSSSVYGNSDTLPTSEALTVKPSSPYALQKYVIEQYLKLFGDLYGLNSICLRFFNVYGPNQLGNSAYSTAISAWLTNIYKGLPLRKDGDGSQTRDMVYIQDVVQALVKAALCSDTYSGEVINVCSGVSISNNEILEMLKCRYGDIILNQVPWRVGDVMHTLGDTDKSESLLGFKTQYGFITGLKNTIRWYEANTNLL